MNKWEVQSTQMFLRQDLNLERVSILAIPNWKRGNFLPVGWLFMGFFFVNQMVLAILCWERRILWCLKNRIAHLHDELKVHCKHMTSVSHVLCSLEWDCPHASIVLRLLSVIWLLISGLLSVTWLNLEKLVSVSLSPPPLSPSPTHPPPWYEQENDHVPGKGQVFIFVKFY